MIKLTLSTSDQLMPGKIFSSDTSDFSVSWFKTFKMTIDVQNTVQYIVPMNAVNYTDLRKNLKSRMDKVYHDHEPLIITRKNNENLVLMSLDDYNSIIETQYLLSSEKNAEHLMSSLKSARAGRDLKKELIEE